MNKYSAVIFFAALYFMFIFVLFLAHSDYSLYQKSKILNIKFSLPQINLLNPSEDTQVTTSGIIYNLEQELISAKGTYSLIIMDENSNNIIDYNPQKEYYAASLYKVPVAIATKKYLENYNTSTPTYINLNNQLTPLLKNSDNGSQSVLINTVGTKSVQEAIEGLGLQPNGEFYQQNIATSRQITTMFANLNGTNYISKADKNEIINLMYQTSFDDRISDHLDEGLDFSHKIGNWGDTGTWHDCGIITGDKNLYVCLMSEQTTFEEFLRIGKLTADFINQL